MNSIFRRAGACAALSTLLLIFCSRDGTAQTADTLSLKPKLEKALQFQLIDAVGVYYLAELKPTSSFRIGADLSIDYSDQSGDGKSKYSYSSSGFPPSSSQQDRTEKTSSMSYQISLSALLIFKSGEYLRTSLYGGVGPIVEAIHSDIESDETYRESNPLVGPVSSSSSTSKGSATTWGVGPLLVGGVRSRVIEYISLSIELQLSATYQWTSVTSSSSGSTTYPGSPTSLYSSESEQNLTGWSIGLSRIRVGVIVNL